VTSISQAIAEVAAAGVDRLDGQLLLLHAVGTPPRLVGERRAWLLTHGDTLLSELARAQFRQGLCRRAAGEPLAYITGHKAFFGLDLRVDARVLVPRPDTEVLVQWALDLLGEPNRPDSQVPQSVLDLGTGSGAIALAIKHSRNELRVDAADASPAALAVAQENARVLGLELRLLQGAWLEPVRWHYDCIVANPPYIAEHDPHLSALGHEPRQALVAGIDGLDEIRTIVAGASAHLLPGGWLLLEHGFDQAAAVRSLLAAAGYCAVTTRRDLNGHERCTGGRVIGNSHRSLVK
jgi:release factor glutamine methyltransferase